MSRAIAVAAATSALVLGSLSAPAFAVDDAPDAAIPAAEPVAPVSSAAPEAAAGEPAGDADEQPIGDAAEEPAADDAPSGQLTAPAEPSDLQEVAPLALLAASELPASTCPSFPGISFDDLGDSDIPVRSPSGQFLTVWETGDDFDIWDAYSIELSDGSELQSDPFDDWGYGVRLGSDDVSVDYDCGRRAVAAGATTDYIAGSTAGYSVVAEKKYYSTADLVRRTFTITNTGTETAPASTLEVDSNLGSDSDTTEVASAAWGRVTNDGEWRGDPVVTYLWGGAGTTLASGQAFAASTLAATAELADQASSDLLSSFRTIPSAYLAGISTPIVNWGASALDVSSTADQDDYTLTYGLPALAPGESATVVEFAHLQMYTPARDWEWLDSDLAAARVDVAYSDAVSGPGDSAGGTYSITWGALPDGLSLDPETGAITGVPTTAGWSEFELGVATEDQTYWEHFQIYVLPTGIEPLIWTDSTLSPMRIGTEYSDGVLINHADAEYALDGSLPRGLSFDQTTGVISGVPELTEDYFFWIEAGSPYGWTKKFFAGSVQDASGTPTFSTAAIGTPIGEVGIQFDVVGLKDGSDYTVQMFSTPVTLASGTISGSTFNSVIMLPANTPVGAHRLLFTGTGFDGQTLLVEAWFAVDAAGKLAAISYTGPVTLPGGTPAVPASAPGARPATLPSTGSDAQPLLHAALLLLLAGTGILVLRQRRIRGLIEQ